MLGRSQTDTVDEASRASDEIETPADLDLDDIYHILQTKRRRDVLHYLRESDGRVRLRELAEQVAAWEQGTPVDNLNSSERQRVYISLYQSHLPKLDNHGIVNYEKDRGWVESTPLTSQLDPYLDLSRGDDTADRWPLWYAGTVALCSIFLGSIAMGLVPIDGLLGGTVVLGAFALLTGVHAWSTDAASLGNAGKNG
ncbi:DUF7344 domain-containing protein [Natrinema caseinilyticum]|uniref:DUF7344 domain-containing protein n=1 Tax=Natrinema caseinilyticum TaxID=2961570 RepID=UPI0020C545FE|nr:hypothetical protein [Natrinema caseinilyticum]